MRSRGGGRRHLEFAQETLRSKSTGFAGVSMQTIEKAERTVVGGVRVGTAQAAVTAEDDAGEPRGQKTRAVLRARLVDDIFTSWFHTIEFEAFDAKTVRVSVPVKFLKTWIQSHYSDDLLACCR